MKKNEANKWLSKNFSKLINEYCLEHWKISLKVHTEQFSEEEDSAFITHSYYGLTNANPEYETATVDLFLDTIKNSKELEKILRHELLHIVLSPYITLEDSLSGLLKTRQAKVLAEQFIQVVCETTIRNLEKIEERRGKRGR